MTIKIDLLHPDTNLQHVREYFQGIRSTALENQNNPLKIGEEIAKLSKELKENVVNPDETNTHHDRRPLPIFKAYNNGEFSDDLRERIRNLYLYAYGKNEIPLEDAQEAREHLHNTFTNPEMVMTIN